MYNVISRLIACFMLTCLLGFGLQAQAQESKQNQAELDREAFKSMLVDLLQAEPEIVIEAIRTYQQQEQFAQQEAQEQAMEIVQNVLVKSQNLPAMGASQEAAAITLVEFFDYQCGYCKRLLPHLVDLIEDQPDVRIVMVELPILSELSVVAAKASLAASRQGEGQYMAFHQRLMESRSGLNEQAIIKLARSLDFDMEQFEQDRNSQEIAKLIEENHKLSAMLGIRGTPAMIVGEAVVPGYVDEDELAELIALERKRVDAL